MDCEHLFTKLDPQELRVEVLDKVGRGFTLPKHICLSLVGFKVREHHSLTTNACRAVLELELTRHADVSIKGVWVSSSGQHTIIALQIGTVPETHYLHANWKKSRVISKLKGISISCVGWNRLQETSGSTGYD